VAEETVDSAPEKKDSGFEFELSKPIVAFSNEVKVLKIRRPTGADLIRIGNPVIFTPYLDPPRIEHDMGKVVAMVAALSNTPSPSLAALDPADLIGLAWAISPFFMPA
jgi:tail assembly chaperone E/41/14-like protein